MEEINGNPLFPESYLALRKMCSPCKYYYDSYGWVLFFAIMIVTTLIYKF